jgi:hypothetical protein
MGPRSGYIPVVPVIAETCPRDLFWVLFSNNKNSTWGDKMSDRKLNVVLGPGSASHRATHTPAPKASGKAPGAELAAGFEPQPDWNLKAMGGRTISDLVFVNRYVGKAGAWPDEEVMSAIDHNLEAAMTDDALQSVIAQYYNQPITSRMLPSALHEGHIHHTIYKDTAEQLAAQLYGEGILGDEKPANCIINMMLPKGVVLSDDFSPGFQPPAGAEAQHARRRAGTIKLEDDDAASSKQGLGGYHGSIHPHGGTTVYYAVGVYSEGHNGIAAFDAPWKSVVATFYHELNEARTDPDVEDVNATGNDGLLSWYSPTGQGEIGDLPINACGGDLGLVFKEVPLANGAGVVPIQLMWSNHSDGPAAQA